MQKVQVEIRFTCPKCHHFVMVDHVEVETQHCRCCGTTVKVMVECPDCGQSSEVQR